MRTWRCERMVQGGHPVWRIDTPDDTILWVPVWSEGDEGRAQFIVDACNAAERDQERARQVGGLLDALGQSRVQAQAFDRPEAFAPLSPQGHAVMEDQNAH